MLGSHAGGPRSSDDLYVRPNSAPPSPSTFWPPGPNRCAEWNPHLPFACAYLLLPNIIPRRDSRSRGGPARLTTGSGYD